MSPGSDQPSPPKAAKLITCVVADDGRDKVLMQALRHDRQVIRASSIACRGIAVLQRTESKRDRLPEPTLVRMLEVAVAENEADALFD